MVARAGYAPVVGLPNNLETEVLQTSIGDTGQKTH